MNAYREKAEIPATKKPTDRGQLLAAAWLGFLVTVCAALAQGAAVVAPVVWAVTGNEFAWRGAVLGGVFVWTPLALMATHYAVERLSRP